MPAVFWGIVGVCLNPLKSGLSFNYIIKMPYRGSTYIVSIPLNRVLVSIKSYRKNAIYGSIWSLNPLKSGLSFNPTSEAAQAQAEVESQSP